MALTETRLSVEEYLAGDWPLGTQLIDGEVVVNQPLLPHQFALANLYALLRAWAEATPGRGKPGLSVDLTLPESVYAPDVWWVSEARRPKPGQLRLDGLPDLVIEVRSESTWRFDIGVKRLRYEEGGVAELWLVDTDSKSVLVYRRSSPERPDYDVALEIPSTEELSSPLLPGFSTEVARIFDY